MQIKGENNAIIQSTGLRLADDPWHYILTSCMLPSWNRISIKMALNAPSTTLFDGETVYFKQILRSHGKNM